MILNSFFFDFDLDSMDIMMTKEAWNTKVKAWPESALATAIIFVVVAV